MQGLYKRDILLDYCGWQSVAAKTATPTEPRLVTYHLPDRRQQSRWLHTLVPACRTSSRCSQVSVRLCSSLFWVPLFSPLSSAGLSSSTNRVNSAVCSGMTGVFGVPFNRRRILPFWQPRRGASRSRRWQGYCVPRIGMPRYRATAARPASPEGAWTAYAKRSTHAWRSKRESLRSACLFWPQPPVSRLSSVS